MKLKERQASAMQAIGTSTRSGSIGRYDTLSLIIFPQSAVGSWIPSPRKLNPAAVKITYGICWTKKTIIGPTAFGRMCTPMMRR